MEEKTFQDLWALLPLTKTFDTRGRYEKCSRVWSDMSTDQRQHIYRLIENKLRNGAFVHPNPCFALDDAMQEDDTRQAKAKIRHQLSFDEYYRRYGTTEPRDGWQMANPTGQKVIYVKNGSMLS